MRSTQYIWNKCIQLDVRAVIWCTDADLKILYIYFPVTLPLENTYFASHLRRDFLFFFYFLYLRKPERSIEAKSKVVSNVVRTSREKKPLFRMCLFPGFLTFILNFTVYVVIVILEMLKALYELMLTWGPEQRSSLHTAQLCFGLPCVFTGAYQHLLNIIPHMPKIVPVSLQSWCLNSHSLTWHWRGRRRPPLSHFHYRCLTPVFQSMCG